MASIEPKAVLAQLQKSAPDAIIKVDLDDRAYVFPAARQLTQLQFLAFRPHLIRVEAVYAFNQSKAAPELFELPAEDARELSRRMVESVYRAQSSQIATRNASVSLTVVANGYILEFGPRENPTELMLSTGCIWRVCNGLARAVDMIAPIASN
jgi:hypothetical protein